MAVQDLYAVALGEFQKRFGRLPVAAAFAPGRIEVLGNHTDYNEGWVLSAAIPMGTVFLAAPSGSARCRIEDPKYKESAEFRIDGLKPAAQKTWLNYVAGVAARLQTLGPMPQGFDAVLLSDVPLGAGLSSSAALEVSVGLALAALYGIQVDPQTLARIGQAAEHEFVGVKCGLLDQISSLYGRDGQLVLTDFRTLEVRAVPAGADAVFILCNTRVRRALVDGEYNERRRSCEAARDFLAGVLPHPVRALRDVSRRELELHADRMEARSARRAAHVIGENERVLAGKALLDAGDLESFGRLMYESHASSIGNFENSCPELDFVVRTAREIPGVLGARLSGGGFGGGAILLAHRRDAPTACQAMEAAYLKEYGSPCDVQVLAPSEGARLLN